MSKEVDWTSQTAPAKQNKSIQSGPLYMAGQAYLRTLPDILDCKDTLGLEKFLKSTEQRVLQIETSDLKFEAARFNNIFTQIRNKSLNVHLEKNCYTFQSWKDITSKDNAAFKAINLSDDINLLVFVFDSPTDNLDPNFNLWKTILRNIETCSHRKLVIIIPPPIDEHMFMDFNVTVVTIPVKGFELSDLTLSSREEILARDVIVLGEEILSFNTLLGDDCKSNDEQVQNKINHLISPILKNLVTDHQYITKITNKLPKLCEIGALYWKGTKRVEKTKLTTLLERSRTDGPLLVISDPEQLSQDYWGEVAEATRGRIFTSEEDGQDLFLKQCQKEPAKVIYLLDLCKEGLTLSEVYNGGLYMPRKFHTRFIIKSMDELVRCSGNKDIFIFNGVEDKLTLISSFKVSEIAEELFVSNDHFRIESRSHELNIGNIKREESFNKHYFKMLEIKGNPCIVWEYSYGSLDGLRPFITRDYSDPIEEGAFSNTKKKLTIIANDPGEGKSTSLTRISELIRGSWVLRIDHNHLTTIDKLPSKLNLLSITKCLIHASGLPTDDVFLRNILQYCLESENSRQVCILVDAFDEIINEKTKVNVLELLKYLKNKTKCKMIITTRVQTQDGLENELTEFFAEFAKITEREQEDYMANAWLPHLALELPEHGESEKGRLRQFARGLREEVGRVLGEDMASFMDIPLQIRMLAEVFRQQAIQFVVSPEQAQNLCKITNLLDLYKHVIKVKKAIYFEQKSIVNKGIPQTIQDEIFSNIMKKHCVLAFQSLVPKFAADYFTNTIITNQELKDISGLGLIRANIGGTFTFIHRTFEEYFCADFLIQWLRQGKLTKENSKLVKNQFCLFLLRPDYYLIRKFIETQLDITSPPIPSDVLENNPIFYQLWSENRQLFFHDRVKTPLHIATEEQNVHIFAILLSGPRLGTTEEAYISFVAARDKAGRTALNIALENGNINIVEQIKENVENCSYDSLLKLMLASFLDFESDRDHILFSEYSSNVQPSTNLNTALIRTKQIRKQIIPFMAAVREDDHSTVQKIFGDMESDTERAYLLIAIDSQGDTAINLVASKEDNMMFKLFAKQGVCISHDKHEQNPLHRAAEKGHISIVIFLLNQSKETYDRIKLIINDNNPDGVTPLFSHTGMYKMFSSIKSKDGSTALQLAAQGGHYDILKELLANGTDIHSKNNDGWTALMAAASKGHIEVIELLLLNGANLNSQNQDGCSALFLAVRNDHIATVSKLLELGADIHIRDIDGWTALMEAASNGYPGVFNLLLSNGADINSHEYDYSALLLAAFNGCIATGNKLLEIGADIQTQNNNCNSALIAAAVDRHLEVVYRLLSNRADLISREDKYSSLLLTAFNGCIATVNKLLEKGADIDTRNNNTYTALIAAASNGHQEVVDLQLLNGANSNSQGDSNSALLLAAFNGCISTVNKVLEKGADIHTRNNNGYTALIAAASNGHLEVVDLLLLNGSDLNSQGEDGYSSLLIAALNGHHATVRKLLEKGADIHTRTNNGWTALIAAASKGHVEVVELLLTNGADLKYQQEDGYCALFIAAQNGYHATVCKLLEKGADIHTRSNSGWTALMTAASQGHLVVVDLLLSNGAELNSQEDGYSALHNMAKNGHHATERKLLEKRADIHTMDNDGWTALMAAARNDHLEVLDLLLLKGADLNSRSEDGYSALLIAAENGHYFIVSKLLEKGADIHMRNNNGWTALMAAVRNGHLDVVDLLLRNGADLKSRGEDGNSVLLIAALNGHHATARKLLEKGADLYARDNYGWTALMAAARNGHLEVVDLLLLNGADLHLQGEDGYSALLIAALNDHLAVVHKLLEKGANIDTKNNSGWTALMTAASKGHLKVVDLLLSDGLHNTAQHGHHTTAHELWKKGADIHTRNNDGWTAIMAATCNGHLEVVDLLLLNGADLNSRAKDGYSALLIAALNGNHVAVRKLLEKGADIHTRDNYGWTALMTAARNGHLEVVDLLLMNGADLNSQGDNGYSALLIASLNGHHATVRKLLEKGADINIMMNSGWTSLNAAASNGHLEVIDLLLSNGANLNSRDEDGDTAFLQAAANGHTEIVVLLLQHGVDVNSQRDDGRTALSWAAQEGHVNVVEILLQHNSDFSCQDKDGKTALSWAEEKRHVEVVDLLRCHKDANPME